MRKFFLNTVYFVFRGLENLGFRNKAVIRRRLLFGIAIIGLLKFSYSCRGKVTCYVQVVDPEVKEQSDTTSSR